MHLIQHDEPRWLHSLSKEALNAVSIHHPSMHCVDSADNNIRLVAVSADLKCKSRGRRAVFHGLSVTPE
jgi:hypothetical protein